MITQFGVAGSIGKLAGKDDAAATYYAAIFYKESIMAKSFARAILLPNLSTVLVNMMARATPYEDGFNIQGHNHKSVGFIEIAAEDEEVREMQFTQTAHILNAIINDPKHAVQPDWSYLKQIQVIAPAETATQPTRSMKKVDAGGEVKPA